MKTTTYLKYISLGIAALALSFTMTLAYVAYGDSIRELLNLEVSDEPRETDPEGVEIYTGEFQVAGWLPDWGTPAGIASMERNSDLLTNVSPVWYYVNPDGTLDDKRPANYQAIIDLARERELEITPTIAQFDHEILTEVLQNEENFQRHTEAILELADNPDYDGIDLDYESTKLSDKDKFYELLGLLKSGFEEREKRLIFTALAQWGNNVSYKSLRETRQVQDWALLAEYVDEIRVMAYDYTSPRAINPGPIAPLPWVGEVLDYAREQGVISKLVLGVHLYSYEWYIDADEYDASERDLLQFSRSSDFNLPLRETPARSYTYDTVSRLISETGVTPERIDSEMVARFRRNNPQTGESEERLLVYIDSQGVQERISLARQKGARGVAFWRIGGEAELLDGVMAE